jgi:deoxyhypusine synthase
VTGAPVAPICLHKADVVRLAVNFISYDSKLVAEVMETTLNNLFKNFLAPVVDAISRIVTTVATVIGDLIGAFNPNNCCGTTAMDPTKQYCNNGSVVTCPSGVTPDGRACL